MACPKTRNWISPKYSVKMVAAITSQATIQGKLVPGKGLKMKLTNQPVELANSSFTCWSMDWAISGPDAASKPGTANVADLVKVPMLNPDNVMERW